MVANVSTVSSVSLPSGCTATNHIGAGAGAMIFNTNKASAAPCGGDPTTLKNKPVVGASLVGATVGISMNLDPVSKLATLTMSCAAGGNWFGVGFNASTMASANYAVVVDGAGKVTEHTLGPHTPGTQLPKPFATVVSSTVVGTLRVVVLTAPFGSAGAFDFGALAPGSMNVIAAIGSTPSFSIHKTHFNGEILLNHVGAPTCICRDPTSNSGTISGMRFNPGVCAPEPVGELLSTHNAICNITEYNGGLYCCHDQSILIDADQDPGPGIDTWRMKYRFYFEEYVNQSNTFRIWWSTEAYNNEYDVPKSTADCLNPATPAADCTHVIRSDFTGKDFFGPSGCMVGGDPNACGDVNKIRDEYGGKFQMTYAAFHCHAPACIKGELWDMDTGKLICRNVAEYGTGLSPSDEKGYVVGIPPCVWGTAAEGLESPPILHLDGNYTTIKHANSTNGHWGVMALWQARAAYLTSNATTV